MDSRVKEIVRVSDGLFADRRSRMDPYLQAVAENFYPERAEFTASTSNSGDWWDNLMSSEPVLKRRELANLIQSSMRPDSQDWFTVRIIDDELDKTNNVRRYLDWMTTVQRRAMYAASAQFSKSMKMMDHDWVAFGMGVVEIDVRRDMPSLAYRTHHLKDFAWTEDAYGAVETPYRRWKPTAAQIVQMFPGKAHPLVEEAAKKEPLTRIACCHVVMPRDKYEGSRKRSPKANWISLHIDLENETVLEETPMMWNKYVIPRWSTVPGSQYAYSPAASVVLADARTLQSVWRVLLEAAEKAVDPPLVGTEEALRSDISIYAGGITMVESDYDERSGAALRTLMTNPGAGIPYGLEMADRINSILHHGFFLDKMSLPQPNREMTAYETQKRLEEHIRAATPLLTPAEDECNNPICERTFEVLHAVNAFGPPDSVPQELQGQGIRYEFSSPIKDMRDGLEAMKLVEGVQMLAGLAQVDPIQMAWLDLDKASPEALEASGVPARWVRDPKAFAAIRRQQERQQQLKAGMDAMQQTAETARAAGPALEQLGAGQ
tara:strand:+ start:3278 stop:4921 length:1644 start_codon:yes stop_codon:yes gene_type:complete